MNPYSLIGLQLQCCIWLGAISFKEDVDLPARLRNSGKDEVPKSLDYDAGLVEQQVFKVGRWIGIFKDEKPSAL